MKFSSEVLLKMQVFLDYTSCQLVNSNILRALRVFKISVTVYRLTQHTIPEHLNLSEVKCFHTEFLPYRYSAFLSVCLS